MLINSELYYMKYTILLFKKELNILYKQYVT